MGDVFFCQKSSKRRSNKQSIEKTMNPNFFRQRYSIFYAFMPVYIFEESEGVSPLFFFKAYLTVPRASASIFAPPLEFGDQILESDSETKIAKNIKMTHIRKLLVKRKKCPYHRYKKNICMINRQMSEISETSHCKMSFFPIQFRGLCFQCFGIHRCSFGDP